MTPEQIKQVPVDLNAREYCLKICEDLMWPQVPSNINLVMEAITAISKGKLCKSRPHPAFSAYLWLDRQIEFARQQGITIDGFFFRDGGYTRVQAPPEEPKNEYKPPSKEELAALEAWKRSEEYAGLRRQWQDLDKKLNMTRVISARPVNIPTLPPEEEKKIIERYVKKPNRTPDEGSL